MRIVRIQQLWQMTPCVDDTSNKDGETHSSQQILYCTLNLEIIGNTKW